jgi:hypothetical protein
VWEVDERRGWRGAEDGSDGSLNGEERKIAGWRGAPKGGEEWDREKCESVADS